MGSIVVGIDGSENSRHALEWAVHEAQLRQAHLDIVSCWEYPMLIASEVMWAPPPDRNSLMAAAATRANTFIEQLQLDETDLVRCAHPRRPTRRRTCSNRRRHRGRDVGCRFTRPGVRGRVAARICVELLRASQSLPDHDYSTEVIASHLIASLPVFSRITRT